MTEDPNPAPAEEPDLDEEPDEEEDQMDRPSDNASYIEPPLGQDALVPVVEARQGGEVT